MALLLRPASRHRHKTPAASASSSTNPPKIARGSRSCHSKQSRQQTRPKTHAAPPPSPCRTPHTARYPSTHRRTYSGSTTHESTRASCRERESPRSSAQPSHEPAVQTPTDFAQPTYATIYPSAAHRTKSAPTGSPHAATLTDQNPTVDTETEATSASPTATV